MRSLVRPSGERVDFAGTGRRTAPAADGAGPRVRGESYSSLTTAGLADLDRHPDAEPGVRVEDRPSPVRDQNSRNRDGFALHAMHPESGGPTQNPSPSSRRPRTGNSPPPARHPRSTVSHPTTPKPRDRNQPFSGGRGRMTARERTAGDRGPAAGTGEDIAVLPVGVRPVETRSVWTGACACGSPPPAHEAPQPGRQRRRAPLHRSSEVTVTGLTAGHMPAAGEHFRHMSRCRTRPP